MKLLINPEGEIKALKKNEIKPNSISGFDLLRFQQTKGLEVHDLKQLAEKCVNSVTF